MSKRDVTGSMRPLDVEETPATTTTPYQLSAEAGDGSSPVSSFSFRTRAQEYVKSNQFKELLFCLGFGTAAYFIGYLWMEPNQRPIPYQYLEATGSYIVNLANYEKWVESTVPEFELGIVVLLCPLLQLVCGNFYGLAGDLHRTVCVYLMAIPLNELTTWTIKVYVGYLRPNFYSLCQPDENFEYCTADQKWQSGRMSFPSGHASYAFCALTLLHLYLEQCLGFSRVAAQWVVLPGNDGGKQQLVVQEPEGALRYRIGSILSLIPLALALFIACSRVVDNMHFPADIVAGGILGALIARKFHFLWFRSPQSIQL